MTNSVLGTIASGGASMNYVFDAPVPQVVVGRPAENIVTLFRRSDLGCGNYCACLSFVAR